MFCISNIDFRILNIGYCDRYQLYGGGKEADQSEISEIICSQAAAARTVPRSNDDRSGSAVKGNLRAKTAFVVP